MICRSDIANVKTDIGEIIGQKVIVKGSLGRGRNFEKEAVIENAYPELFAVKYKDNERITYSYKELLMRAVQLDVFNGEDYCPLLPPLVETKA